MEPKVKKIFFQEIIFLDLKIFYGIKNLIPKKVY